MNELQKQYEKQISELVEASHRCAELNFVTGAGGNLSQRVEDNVLLITPAAILKRKMRFDDICAIDLTGKVLYAPEGLKPTGEWYIHTRIMNKRPDIKAIAHAHTPVLTGFAIAADGTLDKPFLPEPVTEIGPILTIPFGAEIVQDPEHSRKFDDLIIKSNGFLMENHGSIFLSRKGVEDAVELLTMAECMAQSIVLASVLGNAKPLSREHISGMDKMISAFRMKLPGAEGYASTASELFSL